VEVFGPSPGCFACFLSSIYHSTVSLFSLFALLLQSLTTAVDLSASYTALQCAQNMVLDLPDMATTSNILGTMMMLAPWMAGNITTIQTEVTSIGTIKTNVNTKAGLLKTDMQLYGGTKQPSLKRNILGIKGNTSLIQTFQDAYCDATNGTTWNSNLDYFQRVSAGGGKIPLASEFQQGGDDVQSVIIVGGAAGVTRATQYGNRAALDSMNTDLVALYNDIKALPNFRTIGNGLQAVLNAQIAMQQTTNATANLLYLFDNTPVVAGSAPTTADLKSKLDALSAEMANFDLATLRSALVNLNDTINGLPDLDYMLLQFDKLQTVKDVLPCIKKLGDDLASINRTVIGIPGSFGGVADLYTTINATVSANLGSVETIRSNLGTTKTQIRSFKTWEYIRDVDTAQTQVNSALGNLNVTDIKTKLDTMETTFTTVFDFSVPRASVLKFEAVVKDFQIDQTVIASLLNVSLSWITCCQSSGRLLALGQQQLMMTTSSALTLASACRRYERATTYCRPWEAVAPTLPYSVWRILTVRPAAMCAPRWTHRVSRDAWEPRSCSVQRMPTAGPSRPARLTPVREITQELLPCAMLSELSALRVAPPPFPLFLPLQPSDSS
jgi:uncharacterized MnhB-related membrane protein